MAEKSDRFGFTAHSLERGLERIFQYEAPYSVEDMFKIKAFIVATMTWHGIKERWVLEDFKAELVVTDGAVVTIIINKDRIVCDKPVTEIQKSHPKKFRRLGSAEAEKRGKYNV